VSQLNIDNKHNVHVQVNSAKSTLITTEYHTINITGLCHRLVKLYYIATIKSIGLFRPIHINKMENVNST